MILYIFGVAFLLSTVPCLLLVICLIVYGGLEDAINVDDEHDIDEDYSYDNHNQIEDGDTDNNYV